MKNGHSYDSPFSFFDDVMDIFNSSVARTQHTGNNSFPQQSPDWVIKQVFPIGNIFDTVSKLPNCLVSSAYPPSNVFIDKDKNYRIQCACAGYDENSIGLDFDKDHLVITLLGDSPFEASEIMLQSGVKSKTKDYKVNFFIDTRNFDVEKLESSMANGLLDIKIPAVPTKKFTVGVGKPLSKAE